ncbi:phosphatidate cytidylyltransferase [uncultured Tessaracoccus sp.]|uniref:phosphatidate cytidylyltransferase n=1 Tax=uncultured Tessaracoccus sp. TaxID=905023 RepID=UPI0025E15E78|nr:phosphatidate cytidylyltransferase [uncultured Tessaracoccus sp.]
MIRQPAAKYTTPGAGRNLPAAIGVGLALLAPIVVGLVWVDWIFILYVTAMLCLGALEVSHALARREMHAEIVPIVAGTAVTLLGIYWVTANPGLGIAPVTFIVSSLGGTVLAAIIGRLFRGDPTGFVPDIAASAFVIAYIPLIGLFVALLLAPADGAQRIWTLIVCVICSDTGAYVIGVLFGRHKLAPRISPGKTWEGVLGGLACTVVAGVICATWLLGIPWWVGIPLGIAVSIAATVGDLTESLIKRDTGLKDMSNLLPGHGGIMDRLDSMLMAFPVGWFVLNLAMGS